MISRKQLNNALRTALDDADPNQLEYPAIKRERIMWPIGHFQHWLKIMCKTYQQLKEVSFKYDEETIQNELTVGTFKAKDLILKLTYDYKTESVKVFCVGKHFDAVTKTVDVSKFVEEVGQFLNQSKKEPVTEPQKPAVKPKKVIVKKKIIIKKKVSPTLS